VPQNPVQFSHVSGFGGFPPDFFRSYLLGALPGPFATPCAYPYPEPFFLVRGKCTFPFFEVKPYVFAFFSPHLFPHLLQKWTRGKGLSAGSFFFDRWYFPVLDRCLSSFLNNAIVLPLFLIFPSPGGYFFFSFSFFYSVDFIFS